MQHPQMAYNEEEISKAIYLFKQLCTYFKVIQILGYPSRGCLREWIKRYANFEQFTVIRHGRTSPFTQEQNDVAIDFYLHNGGSETRTIQALSHPSIVTFRKWVRKYLGKPTRYHPFGRNEA